MGVGFRHGLAPEGRAHARREKDLTAAPPEETRRHGSTRPTRHECCSRLIPTTMCRSSGSYLADGPRTKDQEGLTASRRSVP
jgi:hypothetical protein